MAKIRKKLYLVYPSELVNSPVLWEFIKKFDVVVNIKSASMKGEVGLVAVEIEGESKQIEEGEKWFAERGIKVDRIEQDIVEP